MVPVTAYLRMVSPLGTLERPVIKRASAQMPKSPPTWKAGAFALLLILPLAFVKLGEPDLWWHIASGRLILQQGIPGVNTFSHAWPEHPWPQTQWLFDVLLGICERVGGLGGVQLFQVSNCFRWFWFS